MPTFYVLLRQTNKEGIVSAIGDKLVVFQGCFHVHVPAWTRFHCLLDAFDYFLTMAWGGHSAIVSVDTICELSEGELIEKSVVKKFFTTAADGKKYKVKCYNLDAIIAVGYRVNSKKATQFRIWSTGVLREYLKQGYALNGYKLKKSPEAIEGLTETLALMESEKYPGKLKGKITLKITKDLEPRKR